MARMPVICSYSWPRALTSESCFPWSDRREGTAGTAAPAATEAPGLGEPRARAERSAVIAAAVTPDKAETVDRAVRPAREAMAGRADMRKFLFRPICGKPLSSSSKHRSRSPLPERRERLEVEGAGLRVAEPVTGMVFGGAPRERAPAHRVNKAVGQPPLPLRARHRRRSSRVHLDHSKCGFPGIERNSVLRLCSVESDAEALSAAATLTTRI